ncbi:MAG: hypothetical protein HY894_07475 [Deltaproteobacteria bacterium]|nr:hypothetical protein [Deltaproteobacteria bacterium]
MTTNPPDTQTPQKAADEFSKRRMIFDLFLHEDDRISQRTDWFLIFNAILFEAFHAVTRDSQQFALGLFGLIVSWVWLMNGIRQQWTSMQLGNRMGSKDVMGEEISKEYKKIFEERRKIPAWYGWARAVPSFTVTIPLACVAAWLFMLDFFQNLWGFYNWRWVVAAAIVIGSSLFTYLVEKTSRKNLN